MNKKRILICDDDEGILDVVKIVLEDKGCEVTICNESDEFFDHLKKVKPKLVFLDLWMPGLGGEEITRRLKSNHQSKAIPVVIMSANKDAQSIAQSIGADEILFKPFNIVDLEKMVDKYVLN